MSRQIKGSTRYPKSIALSCTLQTSEDSENILDLRKFNLIISMQELFQKNGLFLIIGHVNHPPGGAAEFQFLAVSRSRTELFFFH